MLWWAGSAVLSSEWLGPATAATALAATVAGIPAATRVVRGSGEQDPSQVVIDEVAGQLLALAWAPPGWKTALAGLILFRVFDILKPFPLRFLERLPEGFGIMLDDLGAGLYSLVLLQVLARFLAHSGTAILG
jgi:phosphatidylglycerophosphatase A